MSTAAGTVLRIAVWSGPRNISTALMRAWENRPDTAVWDEPLYAYYLATTGLEHPGREQIIQSYDSDWRSVVAACAGPTPNGQAVFYQKHMSHHLLPEVDLGWLNALEHVFLIRDPRAVLLSYSKTRAAVTLEDIGVTQQLALYRRLTAQRNNPPLVIDSADFLRNPRAYLQALCARLGVDFSDRMLSWPAGRRPSDGIWGEYWYATVWRSTGFALPPRAPSEQTLPAELNALADQAKPYYDALYRQRLSLPAPAG